VLAVPDLEVRAPALALRREVGLGLDRCAPGQSSCGHEDGGAGKLPVEGRVGEIVEPCLVELRPDGPPLREAEVARLALDRELVHYPGAGVAGAASAAGRLGSLGDEVLAELERAVQEVHVREALR
jgi:hypothetical protein